MRVSTGRVAILAFMLVCLAAGSGNSGASEFDVGIRGKTLRFQSQPELGYLVQSRPDLSARDLVEPALANRPPDSVRSVRGRGRRDRVVVHAQRSRPENEQTIEDLRKSEQVVYAAPLFSVDGAVMGICPEIIVRRADDVPPEAFQDFCQTRGLIVRRPLEFTDSEFLLEVPATDPDAVFATIEDLRGSDFVEWAVPNIASMPQLRGSTLPNDPYFPKQWHLQNTGQSGGIVGADIWAAEAWLITAGSSDITVAVIDSGLDLNHPDLRDNLVPGYDFYDDDDSPDAGTDDPGEAHGTACAGLIAACGNNGIGVTGVAWGCRIMPVRISGADDAYLTEAEIATALRWAAVNGADVLSNSWGWQLATDAIHSAVVDVTKPGGLGRDGKGCVVLWAAGNTGAEIPLRDPAAFVEVISVGATDHTDTLWDYSAFGTVLDIVGPTGESKTWGACFDLWTTDLTARAGYSVYNTLRSIGGDYTDQMGGTSGACPVVAGVAALILSLEPDLTSDEVRHVLEHSAKDLGDPGRDDFYGWGRVDARAALDMVLARRADLNDDGRVDLQDQTILLTLWGTDDARGDIAPATERDGFVDEQDLDLLLQYWQAEIPEMGST